MKKYKRISIIFTALAFTMMSQVFIACSNEDNEDNVEQTEGHSKNESKIISRC